MPARENSQYATQNNLCKWTDYKLKFHDNQKVLFAPLNGMLFCGQLHSVSE